MAGRSRAARRPLLVVAAVILAGITACSPPTGDTNAEAAIAEINRQYLAAINEGDIDALAALTTEDHMMISSGGEPLAGKQALVDAMTGAFERFDIDETWSPDETVVSGELAYQRGRFVVEATPQSSERNEESQQQAGEHGRPEKQPCSGKRYSHVILSG